MRAEAHRGGAHRFVLLRRACAFGMSDRPGRCRVCRNCRFCCRKLLDQKTSITTSRCCLSLHVPDNDDACEHQCVDWFAMMEQ